MITTRILAPIAAAVLLNSCAVISRTSYRPVETNHKESVLSDQAGLTFELSFRSSSDDCSLHVPIVMLAELDSQPDSLVLSATSSRPQTSRLHLNKFEMVTEGGTTRDLLGEQPTVIEFSSKPPYTASFESKKRPFRIRDGRKVSVNVEGRLNREAIKFSKSFKGRRDNDAGPLWLLYWYCSLPPAAR